MLAMARWLTVGAAQLGPIQRADSRTAVVDRLLALLRQAHAMGVELVVYPELALTTFFPRWYMTDQAEIDSFFDTEMPGPETKRLFDEAARLGIGFYLGYAELAHDGARTRRFNTAILVDRTGKIVGKYRKVHLPGHAEHEPQRRFQHLEKRYFDVPEPGNEGGFQVWRAFGGIMGMCICNDRRWPETYRVMGLQGVELVALGYNTPSVNSQKAESRHAVVKRMIDLLDQAHSRKVDFVVFTELALTTFFPRWYMTDQSEVDSWFEREMPNAATRPLFEKAAQHKIGIYLG
jgi:predicted amidohydrolase